MTTAENTHVVCLCHQPLQWTTCWHFLFLATLNSNHHIPIFALQWTTCWCGATPRRTAPGCSPTPRCSQTTPTPWTAPVGVGGVVEGGTWVLADGGWLWVGRWLACKAAARRRNLPGCSSPV